MRMIPTRFTIGTSFAIHLEELMLESLQFCHHGLIFLLISSFDFRRTGYAGLFRWSAFHEPPASTNDCNGCDILRGLLKDNDDGRWGGR
jgi:hypothetical protein